MERLHGETVHGGHPCVAQRRIGDWNRHGGRRRSDHLRPRPRTSSGRPPMEEVQPGQPTELWRWIRWRSPRVLPAREAADDRPATVVDVPARSQREDGDRARMQPDVVAMAPARRGRATTELATTIGPPPRHLRELESRRPGARERGVQATGPIVSWSCVAAVLSTLIASIRAGEGGLHGASSWLSSSRLGPDGAVRTTRHRRPDVRRARMTRVWLANGGVCYLFPNSEAR